MAHAVEQKLIGLDLDATRARAAAGPAGSPVALALDDGRDELPLALSLEGRRPEIGRPGLRLCRRSPHLACLDFLPHLGSPRQWSAGRHRLDAAAAFSLVLELLAATCGRAQALALAVPAYLDHEQLTLLHARAQQARLRLVGSIATPLALALTAYAEQPWSGSAVVVDADRHALTISVVAVEGSVARLAGVQTVPALGVRAWKERLLNAAADCCIRQSRRDLRESAPTEQSVYEQLDAVLETCQRGQTAELTVEARGWYQNLLLSPEDLAGFCGPLVREAVEVVRSIRAGLDRQEPANVVLLSTAAGRLPGLTAALETEVEESLAERADDSDEDFGDALMGDGLAWSAVVQVLGPDAAARAAHGLAGRFFRSELQPGHLDAAPLPAQQAADAGPARLQFRGRDHLLSGACFTLGRLPDCDLVFDSAEYPAVSARHCEIVQERRNHYLRDQSRNGTLVNDRPVFQQVLLRAGDWIRLGPGGPLLRFLGRGADQVKLTSTA